MRRKSVPVKKYFKKRSLGPFQGKKMSYVKRVPLNGMSLYTTSKKWFSPWAARSRMRYKKKFYM